ncbi:MAG: hypothetical protein IID33_12135, partial [Planctomycetes bacterium]|nr:hypothetical protein [Planctomycetota bacterium]
AHDGVAVSRPIQARADVVVIDPEKLRTGLGPPIEQYDERLLGAMRMVKRSDGVVRQVSVNFAEAPEFTEIDIIGGIGLPPGVDYSELQPTAVARLTLAGIEALPATVVDFTTAGTGGQQWGFDGSTAAAGISRFDIDWRGARYRFSEPGFPIRLTSDMITSQGTVLDVLLRPSQIEFPFTMEIDGLATINFEAAGIVSSSSLPSEAVIFVRPGRLTLELPFPITESTVITFHGGLENTVDVGDDLKNSVGHFRLRVLVDSAPFSAGAVTTPRTIDLDVTIGQQAYAGSVALDETDLSVSETSWVTD